MQPKTIQIDLHITATYLWIRFTWGHLFPKIYIVHGNLLDAIRKYWFGPNMQLGNDVYR